LKRRHRIADTMAGSTLDLFSGREAPSGQEAIA